jgi:putative serine protease PepD
VESDDGPEEEGPYFAWLPPDDRLWRHPSEVPAAPSAGGGPERPIAGSTSLVAPSSQATGWARSPVTRIWAVALVAGLIGAAAASGVGMLSGAFEQQTTVVRSVMPTAPTDTLASSTASGVDWTTVDDAVAPSVVNIAVSSASGPASGSGILFEQGNGEAYIITDSSLVAGADGIEVTFVSGDQYQAHLVGSDPLTGLALVAIPSWTQSFPQLGSVADLQLAEPVLAVGARASGDASVFPGSVSAEDREVDVSGGSTMQNLIAVSGPPAMASSAAGGPLVDQQGRVVGITVDLDPTDSTDQSLIFAVPVDIAMHVSQELLAGLAVTHPWLGVTNTYDMTSADARQFDLSGGAQIGQVWPGSPASRLGLDPSDVITSFNGSPVTSSGTLTQLLYSQVQPGHWASISYLHKGRSVQTMVYISSQPDGD